MTFLIHRLSLEPSEGFFFFISSFPFLFFSQRVEENNLEQKCVIFLLQRGEKNMLGLT